MNEEDLISQRVVDVTETLSHMQGAEYANRAEQAAALMGMVGLLNIAIRDGDQIVSLALSELLAAMAMQNLPLIACVSQEDFKTAAVARASDTDDLQDKFRKALKR